MRDEFFRGINSWNEQKKVRTFRPDLDHSSRIGYSWRVALQQSPLPLCLSIKINEARIIKKLIIGRKRFVFQHRSYRIEQGIANIEVRSSFGRAWIRKSTSGERQLLISEQQTSRQTLHHLVFLVGYSIFRIHWTPNIEHGISTSEVRSSFGCASFLICGERQFLFW